VFNVFGVLEKIRDAGLIIETATAESRVSPCFHPSSAACLSRFLQLEFETGAANIPLLDNNNHGVLIFEYYCNF